MKFYHRLMLSVVGSLAMSLGVYAQKELKPRILVLTDIAPITVEPDDFESTIRLFAHADLFEIEGLVATTGWSNDGGQEHPEILQEIITAYEKDLTNLQKRSAQTSFLSNESKQHIGYWPTPGYLRSKVVMGSSKMGMKFIGASNNSPGADLIISTADEKDDRPVWVLVWGGGNTLAQAIWKVQQERTPEQLKTFLRKLRVYAITDQDRPQHNFTHDMSAHYWMRKEFATDLFFIWDESAWLYQNGTGRSRWEEHAASIQGHGNMGRIYPKYKYGVEGDSPSFFYVWPNGLNNPENPSAGGWGGFFERTITPDSVTTAYVNQKGTQAGPISRKYEERFYQALFNSFVARMAWAKDGQGNRNPVVIVNKNKGLANVHVRGKAGATIQVDASATFDPDKDKVGYSWWVLTEAGTYKHTVQLVGADSPKVSVQLPSDAGGSTIHLICEVTDNGTPVLTSYRRIVIDITK